MSEQAAAAALDQALVGVLSSVDLAFVISSARVPDCPVVYASQSFYTLTGYSAEETLGRNCRFLQQRHGHYAGGGNRKARTPPALGVPARAAAPRCVHGAALAYLCRLRCTDVRELTSAGATQVCEMRSALVEERDCQVRGGAGLGGASLADAHRPRGAHAPPRPAAAARAQVCVLNYRRDGTPFWNLCSMSPIVGADGAVDAYLGVQVDVTAQVLALAREAEAGAGLPAPGAALEAASLCARWRAAHFPAPSAVGRAGEGAYVHDACDGVADPAAPEKRRLRQLLARWHAAQQSGARPAARARRRGLQRQGACAGFRAVLPGARTSVASGLHRPAGVRRPSHRAARGRKPCPDPRRAGAGGGRAAAVGPGRGAGPACQPAAAADAARAKLRAVGPRAAGPADRVCQRALPGAHRARRRPPCASACSGLHTGREAGAPEHAPYCLPWFAGRSAREGCARQLGARRRRYPRERVLGHNCRFLQGRGAAANAPELARLREALAAERPVAVRARHGRPRCSSAGRRAERAAPVGSAWRRRGWSLCALCKYFYYSSASMSLGRERGSGSGPCPCQHAEDRARGRAAGEPAELPV